MGIGILILVLCNWIAIEFWGILPAEMYAMAFFALLVCLFVLFATVPLVVRSNELSEEILVTWKRNLFANTKHKRYQSKRLASRTPISFYYATTKFDQDTQVNYYGCIVSFTANLLVITK